MALRLNDLGKTNQKKNFVPTQWLDESISQFDERSVSEERQEESMHSEVREERLTQKLRPWENYDEIELTTRTYAAREALIKAKKISQKNEALAKSMREGHVSPMVEDRLREEQKRRESAFDFTAEQLSSNDIKIKTSSSFISFIRDLLKH